jgi:hypothetical protein
MSLLKLIAAILFAMIIPFAAVVAKEPYQVNLTVDFETARVSAPNLVDLKRGLKTAAIQQLIPIYTPVSPLDMRINLRGLLANASFAAGSNTLVVTIPNAGISQSFTGLTRDDSVTLFKSYLSDAGTGGKLLRAYARYSPIDPIAGNPNSLMAQMAEADYLLGRLYPLSGCDCGLSQPSVHHFQVGLSGVRGFSKGYDTTSVSLPARYSYSPSGTWAFILDAPLTYNRNGGASSLSGSVGTALRCPVNSRWSLSPVLRAGSGLSLDLATGTLFCSGGVTSVFDFKVLGGVFSLINYVGYITSAPLWTTGINWCYHIQNTIFKNGFVFSTCQGIPFCGRILNASLSFEDTAFTGSRLYIMHYDEVGISLNLTGVNPFLCWDNLACGFAYQFGEKAYRGFRMNLIYQF